MVQEALSAPFVSVPLAMEIRCVQEAEWVAAVLAAVPVTWTLNPQIQAQRVEHRIGAELPGRNRQSLPTRGAARRRYDLAQKLHECVRSVQQARPWRAVTNEERELSGWELYEQRTRALRLTLTADEKADLQADLLAVGDKCERTRRLGGFLAMHVETRCAFDLVWHPVWHPTQSQQIPWLGQPRKIRCQVEPLHGACLSTHAVFKGVFEGVAAARRTGDPFHEAWERLLHKLDGELSSCGAHRLAIAWGLVARRRSAPGTRCSGGGSPAPPGAAASGGR